MTEYINLEGEFAKEHQGKRLDAILAKLHVEYSRSQWSKWIEAGSLLVDEQLVNKKYKIKGGEHYCLDVALADTNQWQAQDIAIEILHADDDIIVVNKPADLVVHPGAGNPDQTLVNAILYHYPECAKLPRAGIVHRLDKDTSGVMVVARSLVAHTNLVQMIANRAMQREYSAIVNGYLVAGGTVEQPIGRDPKHRTRMAVVNSGKPAITHYRVQERFFAHSLVCCKLETGRTHQIRVHMLHINHPIIGDQTYNKRVQLPKGASEELRTALTALKRQALHAQTLGFEHPVTQQPMSFSAPLPDDMDLLVQLLRKHADDNPY